jgi:hypothetical protein
LTLARYSVSGITACFLTAWHAFLADTKTVYLHTSKAELARRMHAKHDQSAAT